MWADATYRTSGGTLVGHGYWSTFTGGTTSRSLPIQGGAAPEANLNQPKADYGAAIPISFGERRLGSQLLWATPIRGDVTNGYLCDFAVSFGYNGDSDPSLTEYTKLYANGSVIWEAGTKNLPGGWGVTLYTGTEDQTADPTMVAALGASNVPAIATSFMRSSPTLRWMRSGASNSPASRRRSRAQSEGRGEMPAPRS